MKKIAYLPLFLCVFAAVADETVTVYQLNGTIQCLGGSGVPPEKAADLLRAQGVKVEAVEQRRLPLALGDHCGAPSGEANVITVAAADWTAFTNQNPDAGGYGVWVFDQSTIQVYMYDGTLQCGLGQEIPIDEMEKMLTGAGIPVLGSRKGTDGLVHIPVCGASTGNINVYSIERDGLAAAQDIGFRMLVSREMTQSIKPPIKRKMSIQARPLPQERLTSQEPIPLLW